MPNQVPFLPLRGDSKCQEITPQKAPLHEANRFKNMNQTFVINTSFTFEIPKSVLRIRHCSKFLVIPLALAMTKPVTLPYQSLRSLINRLQILGACAKRVDLKSFDFLLTHSESF